MKSKWENVRQGELSRMRSHMVEYLRELGTHG